MNRYVGIDLGTTNARVALAERAAPRVLNNRFGHTVTPAVVTVTQTGKRLVGDAAKRQSITNARHTVTAVRRLLGRAWGSAEAQRVAASSSYEVVPGPANDVHVVLGGADYSAEQITSMVLVELKRVAEDYLGEPVNHAAVTVPAYFDDKQRRCTAHACEAAGLEAVLVDEPVAAARAYGFGATSGKTLAVYDFGGATFDVTILRTGREGVDVLATAGDLFLGGEDLDARLVERLLWSCEGTLRITLRRDEMALQRLMEGAEAAKCALSSTDESPIDLPFLATSEFGETTGLHRIMGRRELETLGRDLVDATFRLCEQALAKASIEKGDIDAVLLVGGMTRMPMVRDAVREFFEREPIRGPRPDEAVVLGAALVG